MSSLTHEHISQELHYSALADLSLSAQPVARTAKAGALLHATLAESASESTVVGGGEQLVEDGRTLNLRRIKKHLKSMRVVFPRIPDWVFLSSPTLLLSGVSAQVSFQRIAPD